MDHAGSRADVFIGKPGYFLLKEVDQPAFPLKSRQQRQRRRMHPFGRCRCPCPRRLGLVQSLDYFICELSVDENAPCHLHSVPKSNMRHIETITGLRKPRQFGGASCFAAGAAGAELVLNGVLLT